MGYGRLGRWVLEEIAQPLAESQLGYFPEAVLTPEINTDEQKLVRIRLIVCYEAHDQGAPFEHLCRNGERTVPT